MPDFKPYTKEVISFIVNNYPEFYFSESYFFSRERNDYEFKIMLLNHTWNHHRAEFRKLVIVAMRERNKDLFDYVFGNLHIFEGANEIFRSCLIPRYDCHSNLILNYGVIMKIIAEHPHIEIEVMYMQNSTDFAFHTLFINYAYHNHYDSLFQECFNDMILDSRVDYLDFMTENHFNLGSAIQKCNHVIRDRQIFERLITDYPNSVSNKSISFTLHHFEFDINILRMLMLAGRFSDSEVSEGLTLKEYILRYCNNAEILEFINSSCT